MLEKYGLQVYRHNRQIIILSSEGQLGITINIGYRADSLKLKRRIIENI
jgi:hypothetical protein